MASPPPPSSKHADAVFRDHFLPLLETREQARLRSFRPRRHTLAPPRPVSFIQRTRYVDRVWELSYNGFLSGGVTLLSANERGFRKMYRRWKLILDYHMMGDIHNARCSYSGLSTHGAVAVAT